MRPLPTLLGALVLLAGIASFIHTRAPAIPAPLPVTLEPLPTTTFQAVLIQQTGGELRTRDATLRAADNAPARLGATLAALRTWLAETGAWPRELGAPRVFWLGGKTGEEAGGEHAALDFSLQTGVQGTPDLSIAAEVWLLGSIRRTAARQGVADTFILVNGQVPLTFLGQVTLPQTLEASSFEMPALEPPSSAE